MSNTVSVIDQFKELIRIVDTLKNRYLVTLTAIIFNLLVFSQNDSIWNHKPKINLSGFLDVFYVYDFNNPQDAERQNFLYNHNRHNEFNLNLGLIKLNIEQTKYRANIAIQTGTYANDNYASEPRSYQNIFEANAGFSLNKKNNLWIDAGILPSHIGFESALSSENLTLTRSLLAENSPYFLTGAKFTFNPNERWEFASLLVNGWQRIQRLQGNSHPSFGTQINFSSSKKLSLNWSSFLGTDDPDSTRRMRYFNNFYGIFQPSNKFNFVVGFDIGFQQRALNSKQYNNWLTPIFIGQLKLNDFWKTALRLEYYQDETGIIINTKTTNSFKTLGTSINLDYSPTENLICRFEARWLNSQDAIFEKNNIHIRDNFIVAASIAVNIHETLTK